MKKMNSEGLNNSLLHSQLKTHLEGNSSAHHLTQNQTMKSAETVTTFPTSCWRSAEPPPRRNCGCGAAEWGQATPPSLSLCLTYAGCFWPGSAGLARRRVFVLCGFGGTRQNEPPARRVINQHKLSSKSWEESSWGCMCVCVCHQGK